jgi:hypothetical protein
MGEICSVFGWEKIQQYDTLILSKEKHLGGLVLGLHDRMILNDLDDM